MNYLPCNWITQHNNECFTVKKLMKVHVILHESMYENSEPIKLQDDAGFLITDKVIYFQYMKI